MQAETRIVPAATKPSCPFPAKLELVPPMDNGKLAVGVPIDLPFTDLNKLLEAQLKGKNFPEDNSGSVGVEVLGASIAAAGDGRLAILLKVKAHERKSWFGFGAPATMQIWGKPELDAKTQNSAPHRFVAGCGIGSRLRPARRRRARRRALSAEGARRQGVLDLKPFAADAKAKITAALADFQKSSPGVTVNATIDDVRLTGIEFDSKTLRVIAEADGSAKVAVSELPKM